VFELKGIICRGFLSIALLLCGALLFPFSAFSQVAAAADSSFESSVNVAPSHRQNRVKVTDSDVSKAKKKSKKNHKQAEQRVKVVDLAGDTITLSGVDSIAMLHNAEIIAHRDSLRRDSAELANMGKVRQFNPDANRAVWLSALCPGLGQIYNRRYWKLPLVVGGYVGLAYATSWNNKMLKDYTRAYRDAMDSDPNTKSYMDFYPSTTKESDINMSWLQKSLKSKKDYYRRNRDLCIISMVGLYLVCMVDAYVDASLAHFDISEDLSLRVKPAFIPPGNSIVPAVGLQCAINF
jgi:hypothetical protein